MADAITALTASTAYHIDAGAFEFPYAVDANSAVARHPLEWSRTPWSDDDAQAARKRRADAHAAAVQDAKARGLPEPSPPPPGPAPLVLTPEEQAALDKFRADQAEAKKLVDAAAKEDADRAAKAQAVADARALLAQQPPTPDPKAQRPLFGAAKANAERKAAQQASDAKTAADAKAVAAKAEADRNAAQGT